MEDPSISLVGKMKLFSSSIKFQRMNSWVIGQTWWLQRLSYAAGAVVASWAGNSYFFCGLQGRGGLVNPVNIMDWTPISLPLEGGEIFLDYKIIVVIIMSIQWHLLELQYYIQLYYILICWNISNARLYSLTLSCV